MNFSPTHIHIIIMVIIWESIRVLTLNNPNTHHTHTHTLIYHMVSMNSCSMEIITWIFYFWPCCWTILLSCDVATMITWCTRSKTLSSSSYDCCHHHHIRWRSNDNIYRTEFISRINIYPTLIVSSLSLTNYNSNQNIFISLSPKIMIMVKQWWWWWYWFQFRKKKSIFTKLK